MSKLSDKAGKIMKDAAWEVNTDFHPDSDCRDVTVSIGIDGEWTDVWYSGAEPECEEVTARMLRASGRGDWIDGDMHNDDLIRQSNLSEDVLAAAWQLYSDAMDNVTHDAIEHHVTEELDKFPGVDEFVRRCPRGFGNEFSIHPYNGSDLGVYDDLLTRGQVENTLRRQHGLNYQAADDTNHSTYWAQQVTCLEITEEAVNHE